MPNLVAWTWISIGVASCQHKLSLKSCQTSNMESPGEFPGVLTSIRDAKPYREQIIMDSQTQKLLECADARVFEVHVAGLISAKDNRLVRHKRNLRERAPVLRRNESYGRVLRRRGHRGVEAREKLHLRPGAALEEDLGDI